VNMVDKWLAERRRSTHLSVRPIPWSKSNEWQFVDGALCHRSGRFFSVVGARVQSSIKWLDGAEFPIINQPEIGTLGFLCNPAGASPRWLVQAKAEPGNQCGVQLAPSVQATLSNAARVHGGRPTTHLDLFRKESGVFESDSLQSEQGTRFLNKYNRNAIRRVGCDIEPGGDLWRWYAAEDLRRALALDYTVNTDARSVIATGPWRLIADGGEPFAERKGESEFRRLMRMSYGPAVQGSVADIAEPMALLHRLRASNQVACVPCPLTDLREWVIGHDHIRCQSESNEFDVADYEVEAPDREVQRWDQPLVRSLRQEEVIIFARVVGERLEFLLRGSFEPGFDAAVQFGPSYQSSIPAPPILADIVASGAYVSRMSLMQSDEGGRFIDSRVRYRICELSSDVQPIVDPEGVWVDLAQFEMLCRQSGVVTNEVRSAASLVLSEA